VPCFSRRHRRPLVRLAFLSLSRPVLPPERASTHLPGLADHPPLNVNVIMTKTTVKNLNSGTTKILKLRVGLTLHIAIDRINIVLNIVPGEKLHVQLT
jgi:hypothetical protein